jgi:hypothetical protein
MVRQRQQQQQQQQRVASCARPTCAMLHSLMVQSSLQEASSRPEGSHLMALTSSLCPLNVCTGCSVPSLRPGGGWGAATPATRQAPCSRARSLDKQLPPRCISSGRGPALPCPRPAVPSPAPTCTRRSCGRWSRWRR